MVSFQKLLVPTDFSECSRRAIAVAIDLAKQYRSSLVLLHTWEVPVYGYGGMELAALDMLTPFERAARQELDVLLAEVKAQVPQTTAILTRGLAWREILDAIETTKPDLVVLGTHGRHGLGRALLGSVAEKVVRSSMSPVLTVRAPAEP